MNVTQAVEYWSYDYQRVYERSKDKDGVIAYEYEEYLGTSYKFYAFSEDIPPSDADYSYGIYCSLGSNNEAKKCEKF